MKSKILLNYFFVMIILMIVSVLYISQVIFLDVALIIAILTFGFLPLVKVAINKRIEPLTPKTIIPFTYVMYALGPLYYKSNFSTNTINTYLMFQLIGLIALGLGLNIPTKTRGKTFISDNSNYKQLKLTCIIFVLLSIFSTFTEIISFGGISNLLSIGYGVDRYVHSNNSFMIGGGVQWLLLSGILTWFYGLKISSPKVKLLGAILIGLSGAILTLIGGRSTLVYSAIIISVIYYYEKKKINNKLIIILLIVGIVGAQLYSNARYYLPLGVVETFKSTYKIFINNPNSFLPLPSNINEFRIPAKSLLELIEYGKGEYLLGRSYISAIGTPFPFISRLFSYIGANPNLWFMKEYHSEILAVGGGLGFSPLSEGYMNFGILGIMVHMFFYGRIISLIYSNYKSKESVGSLLLYAGALPIFALDGLRIHSSSMLYKLFRIYLIPYTIYILIKILDKNRSTKVYKNVEVMESEKTTPNYLN